MRRLASVAFSFFIITSVFFACGKGEKIVENGNGEPNRGGGGGEGGHRLDPPADAMSNGPAGTLLVDPTPSNPSSTTIAIDPQQVVITVESGKPIAPTRFAAKVDDETVPAKWIVDRGEIGSIEADSGLFVPSGLVGGEAKITASVGASRATSTVGVKIVVKQNGALATDAGAGSGGLGGVGGEGPGVPVDDGTIALLQGTLNPDPTWRFLYPYDKTVWPTRLLPPLLQWSQGRVPAEALFLHLESKWYEYKGFFGRPSRLASSAPFVRHPIPLDVWKAATLSSAGAELTVTLAVAGSGAAYGPISETWTIAKGALKGTVYYQSYGTELAKNYTGAKPDNRMFGGATLAIRGGATDPVLVAGSNGGTSACRGCHSVSLDGARMVTQQGQDYGMSSSYALTAGYQETPYGVTDNGKFGWVGMYPDGSIGLSNAAPLYAEELVISGLYDMNTGAGLLSSGLTGFATKVGFPAFSPDGKRVAFTLIEGPGNTVTGRGDSSQLVVMDFDRATYAFSNPKLLYKAPSDKAPGWPSFLPTNDAVVFSVQSRTNLKGEFMMTRYGGRGELWWSDVASGTARALDAANGLLNHTSYLPVGDNAHDQDSTLQYEPTVSPVVSGGYAWIVFMSRRMYGNVATVDPWWSDPREQDLFVSPTPKKLWAAAVDLGATPGSDPSHPALYLPAQELGAGNSRGFWVVDPCKADGASCESGDECCGGYCQTDPQAVGLICSNHTNECSKEYDKCSTNADCCNVLAGISCINHRCSLPTPAR